MLLGFPTYLYLGIGKQPDESRRGSGSVWTPPPIKHQNLVVILWQLCFGKISFAVLVPGIKPTHSEDKKSPPIWFKTKIKIKINWGIGKVEMAQSVEGPFPMLWAGGLNLNDKNYCLRPTAEGHCNYLSCSCSGHFVNLLLERTSGLNLAADLGPVLALFCLL